MQIAAGMGAFPLTPLRDDRIDEASFVRLIERLRDAEVDSITALGSTGSYPFLSREERARAAQLAVQHAGEIPVYVGVGSLRTSDVLAHVASAEAAGAAGLLLSAMSYQHLFDDDVFGLFSEVAAATELPIILYDNPRATHFEFSPELIARIAELPTVAAVKIPGAPGDVAAVGERIAGLRALVPDGVRIGISADPFAVTGLLAGCDAWFSVLGGVLPRAALRLTHLAQQGDAHAARAESERLQPLWDLMAEAGGGIRVAAAIAEHLGLAERSCLPLPLRGLSDEQRGRLARVLDELELAE